MNVPDNIILTTTQRFALENQPATTRIIGVIHGMPMIESARGELWAITPRAHRTRGPLLRVSVLTKEQRESRFKYKGYVHTEKGWVPRAAS